jgi:hypothetical protein
LVAKTKVSAVVQALPGYGTVRAAAALAEANIVESRRVGGLGVRQRDALLTVLS